MGSFDCVIVRCADDDSAQDDNRFGGWLTAERLRLSANSYSTVTDLARFRGWSTSQPLRTAM